MPNSAGGALSQSAAAPARIGPGPVSTVQKNWWHYLLKDRQDLSLSLIESHVMSLHHCRPGRHRLKARRLFEIQIAEWCNRSWRQVRRVLKALRSRGIVERRRTGRGDLMRVLPPADWTRMSGQTGHPRPVSLDTGVRSERTPSSTQTGHPCPPSSVLLRKAEAGAASSSGVESATTTAPPSALFQKLTEIIGLFPDAAVQKLWEECRKRVPDCTVEEIGWFVAEKKQLISNNPSKFRNPVGFLLTAVPECFESEGFREYRSARRKP